MPIPPEAKLRSICLALPGTTETAMKRGPTYRVADKIFAWDRQWDGGATVWVKLAEGGQALVAGNAPLDVVAGNAARAAALFGWEMPIPRGRDRPILRPLVTAQPVLGAQAMSTTGSGLPDRHRALSTMDCVSAMIAALD